MSWLLKNNKRIITTEEKQNAVIYWKLILLFTPIAIAFVFNYWFYLKAPKTAIILGAHTSALLLLGISSFKLKLIGLKTFTRLGVLTYLSIFIGMCMTTGGILGPNIWWLITTPVISSNFTGKKETIIWSLASLALTLVNFYPPFQSLVINEISAAHMNEYYASSVVALAVVFAATGYFAIDTREKIQNENDQAMAAANHSSNLSSLGEMAGGIAHEINNPLMIISGSAKGIEKNMLKEEPNLDKVNKHLQTIYRSIERVAAIIKGLKTLARDGNNDEAEAVTLASSFEDVLGLLGSKLSHAGIELVYDKENPLFQTPFPLYRVQFSQVILNLLSNSYYAIKSQEKPWIRLEISKNGSDYQLRITDSGKGISNEVAEKIFTPFYTSKPIGEGTGLGLPLCHSIMRKCGGDLSLDQSYPNTSFVLTLPEPCLFEEDNKAA